MDDCVDEVMNGRVLLCYIYLFFFTFIFLNHTGYFGTFSLENGS